MSDNAWKDHHGNALHFGEAPWKECDKKKVYGKKSQQSGGWKENWVVIERDWVVVGGDWMVVRGDWMVAGGVWKVVGRDLVVVRKN